MSNQNKSKKEEKTTTIIINAREVEGFNPEQFKRMNDNADGFFIPLQVQIHWFWKEFPNGRLVIDNPIVDPEGTVGKLVAKAYVYSDRNDVNSLLSSASARRGVNEDNEYADAYDACQGSALSKALRFAGFTLPLTDDDLFVNQKLPEIVPTSQNETEDKPSADSTKVDSVKSEKVDQKKTVGKDKKKKGEKDDKPKETPSPIKNSETEENDSTTLIINPDDEELVNAAKYLCTHASYENIPLMDLINTMDKKPAVKRIIKYLINSPTAQEKHPKDVEQLTILLSKLNLLDKIKQ